MELLVLFAFLAGIVTILSPCILPLLPVVLSGSVSGGKARPWGIITGFIVSFTAASLALAALVKLLNFNPDILRWVAAAVVIVFGLIMVVPPFQRFFSSLVTRLTSRAGGTAVTTPRPGYWGGLLLGVSLGLVWTPCVGPILASVLALAASSAVDFGAVLIMAFYALGTAIPLLLIMLGGRGLLDKLSFLKRHGEALQRVFGVLMIATGVLVFTGWDRQFQTAVLSVFPQYGAGLTGIENQNVIQQELTMRNQRISPVARSGSPYEALALGGAWINSKALGPADLEGKIVLIDFWTYSCINCIRTFPYLKAWDARYRDKGLVIIGVHTPEFAFEKDTGNVRRAVRDFGLDYAVVQDNDYNIWRAFANHYWPAHFLYDGTGRLVDTHFGEGDYDKTEGLIQKLVGDHAAPAAQAIAATLPADSNRTPETYLGYGRASPSMSPFMGPKDRPYDYKLNNELESDHWALGGTWTQEEQDIVTSGPGLLEISFRAKNVYIVLGPAGTGPAPAIRVTKDGLPVDTRDVRGGVLTLNGYRLYELFIGTAPTQGRILIESSGPLKAYVFTFG